MMHIACVSFEPLAIYKASAGRQSGIETAHVSFYRHLVKKTGREQLFSRSSEDDVALLRQFIGSEDKTVCGRRYVLWTNDDALGDMVDQYRQILRDAFNNPDVGGSSTASTSASASSSTG